jgi:23S rRNA pseudouridine2605 synthase
VARNAGPGKGHVGLGRALSKMGFCSRSEAFELIRAGRVQLKGVATKNAEAPVRLGKDRIAVDGVEVVRAEKVYWMMNKPSSLVTTTDDEKGRETVYAKLPAGLPWMGPVGRLDKASEGLLLFTNDTEWAARITAPESHLEKTYSVQYRTAEVDWVLQDLRAGVKSSDGEVLRAKRAKPIRSGEKNSWVEIVLDEGKNRQIRRMFEALGIEVLRLVRIAIGPLELGSLGKGMARALTPAEKEKIDRALLRAALQD